MLSWDVSHEDVAKSSAHNDQVYYFSESEQYHEHLKDEGFKTIFFLPSVLLAFCSDSWHAES